MSSLVIRPDRFCRTSGRFFLILDSDQYEYDVEHDDTRDSYEIRVASGPVTLSSWLEDVPSRSDVLVVSRNGIAQALPAEFCQQRNVAVVSCDTTPVTDDQVQLLMDALERCPSPQQVELANRVRDGLWRDGVVTLVSRQPEASATLTVRADWLSVRDRSNVPRRPTMQLKVADVAVVSCVQVGGTGEPVTLPVSGRLAFKGRPIVRAQDLAADRDTQRRLYEALSSLESTPAVADVSDGVIIKVSAADPRIARVFDELFAVASGCRAVSSLGVGLELDGVELPGNVEANRAFGAGNGRLFVALGDIATDRFDLVLPCESTGVMTSDDDVLAGEKSVSSAPTPRRRLNRVRSASCGCH